MMHFRTGAKSAVNSVLQNFGFEIARTNSFKEAMQGVNFRDYVAAVASGDPVMRAFMKYAIDGVGESKSQNLQDLLVDFLLAKEHGFFVEFGATDGLGLSNSHYLQYKRSWTGILAEPGKVWHDALRKNRPGAIIDTRCVWRASGERLCFREADAGGLSTIADYVDSDLHAESRRNAKSYEVETISLNDLLQSHGAPTPIDYLSVDTEGSEFEILSNFAFNSYRPAVITVEHNFTPERDKLYDLIVPKGYRRIFEGLSLFDDWYVRKDIWQAVIDRRMA